MSGMRSIKERWKSKSNKKEVETRKAVMMRTRVKEDHLPPSPGWGAREEKAHKLHYKSEEISHTSQAYPDLGIKKILQRQDLVQFEQ
jgi:hypothetical protein